MDYMRVRIISDAVDLHGVMLRDAIRQMIVSNAPASLVGEVRNIDNGVEILCNDAIAQEEFIGLLWEVINRNELIEDKFRNEKNIQIIFLEGLFDKGFQLKRSNELQETVWALQGAGRLFKNIGGKIDRRDKRKVLGLLKGIKYEIYFNEVRAEDPNEFSHNAIDKFLTEVPADDERLIDSLQNYRLLCKRWIRTKAAKKSQISELTTKIDEMLDKKIELLGKEIGETYKNIHGGEKL
jgi:hypothetical protein